jgi:hypothetical protein
MKAIPNEVGKRGYPLRFTLEPEQEEKVADLLKIEQERGVAGSVGTVIRTLLELATPTSDFLGQMRLVLEKEKILRRERSEPREPIYFNLEVPQEDKLNTLLACARGNGVRGWSSTVVRTLVEMATPSADFLQQMEVVKLRETMLEKARREQPSRKKAKAS